MHDNDFLRARLGREGPEVFRLGLSATYRPGERAVRYAMDEGVNYLFFLGFDWQMIRVLREQLPPRREKFVVATGAYNLIWTHQGLRRTLERRLRQIRSEYIDVFHFLGVTRRQYFTSSVRHELEQIRKDERVRAVSISCHDPEFAAELVREGTLDTIMIRYNAAARGAADSVFPAAAERGAGVVTHTATSWTYLLQRPKGWPASEPVADAGLCYRFVLSNPGVNVCLTAPRTYEQSVENLAAVRRGPLTSEEANFMERFGQAVGSTLAVTRHQGGAA